jgi:ESCRT-I complex subunit VPS28
METMAPRPSQTQETQEAAPPANLMDRLGALLSDAPEMPEMEEPKPTAPPAVVAEAQPPATAEEATAAPAIAQPLVARALTNLSPAEKRDASMQAELFSIMVTMEHLEGAFVKNLVSNDVYEEHCRQIVTQFKTLQKALSRQVPDVAEWMQQQGLECPLAKERLLGTGVAATMLHATGSTTTGKEQALAIHSTTEHFITCKDSLDVGYKECLDLLPLIRDLQQSIVSITNMPQLAGMERITNWLVTLNNMRASESLTEDQIKQLKLDLELAYTSFSRWLKQ